MEQNIEQALQQGVAAHNAGNLQEAERAYQAILQSEPKHPDANHNLGLIAISVNQIEAALPLFKTALSVNPNIEQFWLSYIDALVKAKLFKDAKQAIKKAKKKGFDSKKLQALLSRPQQTVNINVPPDEQLSRLLGLYQNGRLSEAEQLALQLTQDFPEHHFGWKVLAAVLSQAGRVTDSFMAMQKSVELAPQDAEAHYNLGGTLQGLGRLDAAEESYMRALALKPDFAEAQYNLGNTLKALERLDEAEVSYVKALALKPAHAEAHNNLANTLLELGRLDEAEASYTQAILLKFNLHEAHYNLGNTLKKLGRLPEAETSYLQAIALKPDYANAHSNLGNVLRAQGRLEEAKVSYARVIALKPSYAEVYNNLGSTLQEQGRFGEAEEAYKKAISLKSDFSEAHSNLGILLFEGKKYDLAAEQFELCDTHQSKLHAIQCSYLLEKEAVFYEKFDALINEGEINAVIGSLAFRSEFRYGIKTSNPFCSDPLRYVVKSNLNDCYDFKSIFVKTARDIFSDNSVSYREQGLLTNGTQTAGNIFTQEKVLETEIENIIFAEIEKYRIQFQNSEEGFIKNWPASYEIQGWLVCMRSGGKLASHMHESGWITGSIYINVPPKSETDSGNLVLCLGDEDYSIGREENSKNVVDVETGSLCLFPSSLHHYTVPFEEKEDRIVLAFDVVPKN